MRGSHFVVRHYSTLSLWERSAGEVWRVRGKQISKKQFFLVILLTLSLTSCTKPQRYCPKLQPGENSTALKEYKTTHNVNWPLSAGDKSTLQTYSDAKWIHIDLYVSRSFKSHKTVESELDKLLPNLRHVTWHHDETLRFEQVRLVISEYTPLLPLGPNWYAPEGNRPLRDHGRAKAHNLGVMIDDPYELKTTAPVTSHPGASLQDNLTEKVKIDVETR